MSLAACGGGSQAISSPSQGRCFGFKPYFEQLYPIPESTAVSPGIGQVIVAGTGLGTIRLYEGAKLIAVTKPEPLPNPLPTPIVSPVPYATNLTTTFAVSLPPLKAHTTYFTSFFARGTACLIDPPSAGWVTLASFSTK
jgi:hypothetical protein